MAPWLTDFVLAKLEISSPRRRQEIHNNPCSLLSTSSPPPQLVLILARGGDWWTNPIENSNEDAWVMVSDGKHCVKSVLTPAAMQHILDEQPTMRHNNNSAYRFYNYSRGSCALIRDYALKIQKSDVTGTTSILLSVGSMEAKPGFHLPTDSHQNVVHQAVEDDIDVRYAIQAWNENQALESSEQQIPQQQGDAGKGSGRNETGNATHSNKRMRTVPLGDVMSAILNDPQAYEEILSLAEKQERKECQPDDDVEYYHPASQDTVASDVEPATQLLLDTQPPAQYLHDSSINPAKNPATPDSLSRMYIQNVLMTQDVEEKESDDDCTVELTPRPGRSTIQSTRSSNNLLRNSELGAKTTWELVKEQLKDPNCKIIVFHTRNIDEGTIPHIRASPPTNSGAYLCQHGLHRWLQHNLEHNIV
jgi:TusA-related sulfurtransferase